MVIFFDIDDTLFDHSSAAKMAVSALFEHHRAQILADSRDDFVRNWFDIARHYNTMYLNREISLKEHWDARIRSVFRGNLSAEQTEAIEQEFTACYEKCWTPFPDVQPCLASLKGERLGIITNGQTSLQHRKLRILGLFDHFHTVVTSEEVGVPKPQVGIFLAACERASADPKECAYVGDRIDTDARASSAAGMTAILVDRRKLIGESPEHICVIHSLRELRTTLNIGGSNSF